MKAQQFILVVQQVLVSLYINLLKKSEHQIMLLEYNYLTSPEKLMEYHRLYFDDNLVPLKIDDLKQIEFNKNSFEIKKLGKFLQNE